MLIDPSSVNRYGFLNSYSFVQFLVESKFGEAVRYGLSCKILSSSSMLTFNELVFRSVLVEYTDFVILTSIKFFWSIELKRSDV